MRPRVPMKLHLAKLPRLIIERRGSVILGVVIIAMLWAGITVKYFESVRTDQSEAERTNKNYAMVFEENVLRSLSEVDKAVLYLRHSVEVRKDTDRLQHHHPDHRRAERHHRSGGDRRRQRHHSRLDGRTAAQPADQRRRPGTLSGAVNDSGDHLFISKPLIGRASGQMVGAADAALQQRRRLVSAASSSPRSIRCTSRRSTTRSISVADAAIAMIGSDGVVRSSGGSAIGRFGLGQNLSDTVLFQHMQQGHDTMFEYTGPENREPLLWRCARCTAIRYGSASASA